MNAFQPAVRHALRGRIALDGPSGSGKSFTALRLATALAGPQGRIAIINSESGAVQKYLGLSPDGQPWQFDICELTNYSPSAYTELILAAGQAGYAVLIVDSLSHAWEGEGGALEQVTNARSRGGGGNSFTAWKDVTPMHNRMVGAILRSPCHVIVTMRSKTEYVLEPDANGKMVPRKIGMAPVQRAGMEYEFDLYCSMDWDHVLRVRKSRCPDMDGVIAVKPSSQSFAPLVAWLNEGSQPPEGFYTANERDFSRLEETKTRAIAADSGKSAIEKLREQKAARDQVQQLREGAGTENGKHADPPPPSAFAVKESAPCTEAQVVAIRGSIAKAAQTGMPDIGIRVKQRLADCGVDRLAGLTVAEADQLRAAIDRRAVEEVISLSLKGTATVPN